MKRVELLPTVMRAAWGQFDYLHRGAYGIVYPALGVDR